MQKFDFRNHDLSLLVVFITLWDCRSVTRASESLSLTQPAVSHALRRLRESLGDPLFVRGRGGLLPTPRAIGLIGPIREALEQIDRALKDRPVFDPAQAQRSFTVAAGDFVEFAYIPLLAERIAAAAPGLTLKVVAFPDALELPQQLEQNAIDLALTILPLPELNLCSEKLVEIPGCTMIGQTEGVPCGRFPLELYLERKHVILHTSVATGNLVDQALALRGQVRLVGAEVQNVLAMPAVAARTGYICTVPRPIGDSFAAVYGLSCHEPPIDLPTQHLTAYWHPRFDTDPALTWLREQIKLVAFEETAANV